MTRVAERWEDGNAYEQFIGRWSRRVGRRFVRWLDAAPGLRWADVGCGTGALTTAVLDLASPASVLGVDPSPGFVEEARRRIDDPRVALSVGGAVEVPAASADLVVSGLVLNFLPDPGAALTAMTQATPGGTVAAYVWDYAGRMQLLRTFWDVACALDVAAVDLDEGERFALCTPPTLVELWEGAGLSRVRTTGLEVTTEFRDFEDLWAPFLGGTGSAPGYVASLEASARDELRAALERMVHPDPDGHIRMPARAWAVRGQVA